MGKRDRKGLNGVARFLVGMEPSPGSTSSQSTSVKETVNEPSTPPSKKRKLGSDLDRIGCNVSHLIERYNSADDVPEHLKKYFAQRHRYFSLYDHGCLLDEEGWYSVTPEKIADQIAERCRCDTILDAFCGVGGNAIAFAKTCHRVIAIDNSPVRLALARHNATVYGVQDRIEFVLANYLDFARTYAARPPSKRSIDVVFLSPPWGGPSYLTESPQKEKNEEEPVLQVDQSNYSLRSIRPIPGDELFRLTRCISHNIAYFLPRNVNLEEISRLTQVEGSLDSNPNLVSTQRAAEEYIEVEEEYMGGKLKAVTCYFGGLVAGQEHIF